MKKDALYRFWEETNWDNGFAIWCFQIGTEKWKASQYNRWQGLAELIQKVPAEYHSFLMEGIYSYLKKEAYKEIINELQNIISQLVRYSKE